MRKVSSPPSPKGSTPAPDTYPSAARPRRFLPSTASLDTRLASQRPTSAPAHPHAAPQGSYAHPLRPDEGRMSVSAHCASLMALAEHGASYAEGPYPRYYASTPRHVSVPLRSALPPYPSFLGRPHEHPSRSPLPPPPHGHGRDHSSRTELPSVWEGRMATPRTALPPLYWHTAHSAPPDPLLSLPPLRQAHARIPTHGYAHESGAVFFRPSISERTEQPSLPPDARRVSEPPGSPPQCTIKKRKWLSVSESPAGSSRAPEAPVSKRMERREILARLRSKVAARMRAKGSHKKE